MPTEKTPEFGEPSFDLKDPVDRVLAARMRQDAQEKQPPAAPPQLSLVENPA